MNPAFGVMLIVSVIVATFSFVAVVIWVQHRLKEREAYYQSETVRKIADSQGGNAAVEYLREKQRLDAIVMREKMRIGGVVGTLASIGLMIFLHAVIKEMPIYLVGLIMLLAGVGVLVYSYFLAPNPEK